MRMKLKIDTPTGDYIAYPIYDIDYTGIYALGGTTTYDRAEGEYHYHQWEVVNNAIWTNDKIPATIPRREIDDGNIIPFWHNYPRRENGVYKLPEETRNSFDIVPIGVIPEDWGTNPNYVTIENVTIANNYTAEMPFQRTVSDTWDATTQYYLDTKRVQTRLFYLDNLFSFSVAKGSYWSVNRYVTTRYAVASVLRNSNTTVPYGFSYPDSGGTLWNRNYEKITYDSRGDFALESFTQGINCTQIFVHYTHNNREYYGIALVTMSDFTERANPVAIRVCAWDASWWGTNIVPGGEGSGSWGSDNVISGGNGTFTFTSDSTGDKTGVYIVTRVQSIITSLSPFFSGTHGYKIHQILPANMSDLFGVLYGNTFIGRFTQAYFNPLSAVLSLHMIPAAFLNPTGTSSNLILSGYDVSGTTPIDGEKTGIQYPDINPIGYYGDNENIKSFDFKRFFDAFPDFAPYTTIKLHLPYIGVIDIDTNAVMYGTMHVMYLCDIMSGNVCAEVWCSDKDGHNHPLYTASGNAGFTIPLFAMNQDGSAVGKVASSAISMLGGAITGDAGSVFHGAMGFLGSVIGEAFSPQSTSIVGQYSGNVGMIESTEIFLEITRPVWVETENYQKLKGIPAILSGTIKDCGTGEAYSGYCVIESIDLDDLPCTDDEKQEIETLLKQGVYIRGDEL